MNKIFINILSCIENPYDFERRGGGVDGRTKKNGQY